MGGGLAGHHVVEVGEYLGFFFKEDTFSAMFEIAFKTFQNSPYSGLKQAFVPGNSLANPRQHHFGLISKIFGPLFQILE